MFYSRASAKRSIMHFRCTFVFLVFFAVSAVSATYYYDDDGNYIYDDGYYYGDDINGASENDNKVRNHDSSADTAGESNGGKSKRKGDGNAGDKNSSTDEGMDNGNKDDKDKGKGSKQDVNKSDKSDKGKSSGNDDENNSSKDDGKTSTKHIDKSSQQDGSKSDLSDESLNGGTGGGNTREDDIQQVVECPKNWEYRCVLDLEDIHPKGSTAKQFCDGQDGYITDGVCHIEPGPLIEANQCCRFG